MKTLMSLLIKVYLPFWEQNSLSVQKNVVVMITLSYML